MSDAQRAAVEPDRDDPEIRRATLADWPSIHRFLQLSYGPLADYKGDRRWRWQFIDNPGLSRDTGQPSVWIAVHHGAVVGQVAVQAGRFWIGQMEQPGGWIVDVMILPAYRGRRLGHRLYAAASCDVKLLFMLTMAPATRRIAERAGAVTLNPAMQFSRWSHLRPDDVTRYFGMKLAERPRLQRAAALACGPLQLHRAAAAAANIRLSLRKAPHPTAGNGITVEETDGFGPEFDAFWRGVRSGIQAGAVRDAAYLHWRFRQIPDIHYRCFVARRSGLMAGYSVLRRAGSVELRLGIISDMLTASGDHEVARALARHALGFFGREIASIECVTSLPGCARMLAELGFLRSRTTRATCTGAAGDLRACIEASKFLWLFTKSDHDWDQIHVA